MNLLRKVKSMLTDEELAEDAVELSPHDEVVLTLQLSIPRLLEARGAAAEQAKDDSVSLAGQLLVATPMIEAGPFAKSVVYLFRHDASGAAGLIVNQPMERMGYDTLIQNQNMDLPRDNTARDLKVYAGGPCDRHRGFMLHSSEYVRDFNLCRHGELAVTCANTILNDMSEGVGPRAAALVLGYAGWGPGQLEHEIAHNGWMHVPASEALVLGTADELKWAMANKSLGVSDIAFFSNAVGHA